jgi:hypothetical protein
MPVTALTVLVVIETMLLALLSFVVVGLLRSHAEILRRLPEEDAPAAGTGPRPVALEDRRGESRPPADTPRIPSHLPGPRAEVTPAHDLAGRSLDGSAVVLPVATAGTPTLVAFLSSGCLTCRTFWDGLREGAHLPMPGDARVVAVTKDREMESPSRLLDLAPTDVPVVMSSEAWGRYGVTMSPYFVMVGADGEVRGEGAAGSWEQVRSLLADAVADEALARAEQEGTR